MAARDVRNHNRDSGGAVMEDGMSALIVLSTALVLIIATAYLCVRYQECFDRAADWFIKFARKGRP